MPPLGRLKLLAFLPFRNPLFTDVGVGGQQSMRCSGLSMSEDTKTNRKLKKSEYRSNK